MRFKSWEAKVIKDQYENGGIALTLLGFDTEPFEDEEFYIGDIICASVWVAGLADDEVAIKDYSENSGVLAWLMDNNFIDIPIKTLDGFYVFNLNKDAPVYIGSDIEDMHRAYSELKNTAKELRLISV